MWDTWDGSFGGPGGSVSDGETQKKHDPAPLTEADPSRPPRLVGEAGRWRAEADLAAEIQRWRNDHFLAEQLCDDELVKKKILRERQQKQAPQLPPTAPKLRQESISAVSQEAFVLSVHYSQPLAEMIAAGHYDWENGDITANHFPVKGEGVANIEIQLVHFNRVMGSDTIIRELDTMGLRPATIEELLAFGAKYPDIQREFPIVALGSVWRYPDGYRYVPYLCQHGARRDLRLDWFEHGWSERSRFAAVRKPA